ncbi:MAG: AAA family ATPase [Burkholderiales bacterium]|nr:AAA family ATPase [Burkholderiales bacterium]
MRRPLSTVVPELQALLGETAPVPELGPIESITRLRGLLVALIGAVTSPRHPLVVFIDDLQWADQPSLDFIAAMLQDPGLNGLMLIGAYRDNEVDASHPLATLLRGAQAAGMVVPTLALDSLALADTTDLVADMLHMPQTSIAPLADVIYAKTGGNPFYTVEFLNTLYRDGVLTLSPHTGAWQWDAARLGASNAADSVVDFLAQRLSRLPEDSRQMLLTAACLGNVLKWGCWRWRPRCRPRRSARCCCPRWSRAFWLPPARCGFCRPITIWPFGFAMTACSKSPTACLLPSTAWRSRCRWRGALEPWVGEPTATFALHSELHLVLFSLARHGECDAVFEDLQLHAQQPVALVEPACIQVVSLSNRTRYADAVALSAQLLAQPRVTLPAGDRWCPRLEELGLFTRTCKVVHSSACPRAQS